MEKIKEIKLDTWLKIIGLGMAVWCGLIAYNLMPVAHSIEIMEQKIGFLSETLQEKEERWSSHIDDPSIHQRLTREEVVQKGEFEQSLQHVKELIRRNYDALLRIEGVMEERYRMEKR